MHFRCSSPWYHVQGSGISSISSAQEPRSENVSIHIAGRMEVEPRHTLILQEGPNGHLLALLFFRRYEECQSYFLLDPPYLKRRSDKRDSQQMVERTHDCGLSLVSALEQRALVHWN